MINLPRLLRPVWMEVDLDRLAHNIHELRRVIGPDRKLIAVAKAEAYGHGVAGVVPTMLDAGADIVAVGNLKDAIKVREKGCRGPLLLFGSSLPNMAEVLLEYDICPTIWDVETARVYSQAARKPVSIYLKVDSGFHRLGVLPKDAGRLATEISKLPHLHIECIYTHMADPLNEDYTREQYMRFTSAVDAIHAAGVEVRYACAAPSAILSRWPDMYNTAVDPGRLVYGFYFPPNPTIDLHLQQVLRAVKTCILQAKWIEEGESIGYGRKFKASRRTYVAVLPIGWSDGLMRNVPSGAQVLIAGKRCPFIGSVNLEHSLIDITDVPEVGAGDEVVIIGRQGDDEIYLSEHCKWMGVTEFEITVPLGRTVSHFYFKDGQVVHEDSEILSWN